MIPIFENKSEITLEKYLYQCNNPVGKKAIKKLKRWKMLQIFAMAVMAVNAIVCFVSDAMLLAIISIIFCMAFLYKLLVQRNRKNRKIYEQIMKNNEAGKWYRTITFDKDIKVTDGNTVTSFKYYHFVELKENEKYYLLFKDENAALRIEKGAFTIGDEGQFADFINSKIKKKKK